MKTALVITSVITTLLILSTLICGLWITNQGNQIPDLVSSINFHKTIGITSAIFMVATMSLAIMRK